MKKLLQINLKLSLATLDAVRKMEMEEYWSFADLFKTAVLAYPANPQPANLQVLQQTNRTHKVSVYISDSYTLNKYKAILQNPMYVGLTHSDIFDLLIRALVDQMGIGGLFEN
jgi:hypothetical protein